MKKRQNSNLNCQRGYIGLIALLIAVLIMVFLMLQEYQSFGLGQLNKNVNATTTDTGNGATSGTMTPIEQAQNVKKIIESHDKNLLNQMNQ